MRSSSAISQPIIVQSAFIYSIVVGDIMVLEIKVLPLLRRIKGYSAGCNFVSCLNHNGQELRVVIRNVCLFISGMFMWASLPLALILLRLVFMPAVLGFMVESSAMRAWIFVPLVTVVCEVSSRLAVFAI